ncbi:40S ribosomal protein S25 [Intoshia linei]|uniref:40S ribosomal protein S25 n=1 Tax=Intoshia linei TaxID=1819745 RepID=A0A177BCL1_9BILA|nr:40S ribosomal protein S25 [Intoshia linei]
MGAKKNQQATQKAAAKKKPTAKKTTGGKSKKKSWSKGKVRDKLVNAPLVVADQIDKLKSDISNSKLISISSVSERFKLKGSVSKRIIKELHSEGKIRQVVQHSKQMVYTKIAV